MAVGLGRMGESGLVLTEVRGRARLRRVGPVADHAMAIELALFAVGLALMTLAVLLWSWPGSIFSDETVVTKAALSSSAVASGWVLLRSAIYGLRVDTVFDFPAGEIHRVQVNAFGLKRQAGRLPLDWIESLYVHRTRGGSHAQLCARLGNGDSLTLGTGQATALKAIHASLTDAAGVLKAASAAPVPGADGGRTGAVQTRAIAQRRRVRVRAA